MSEIYLEKRTRIILFIVLLFLPVLIMLISIKIGLAESDAYYSLFFIFPITAFGLWIYDWTGNICAGHSSKSKNPKKGYFVGLLVPYFFTLFVHIFLGLLSSVILTWLYKRRSKKSQSKKK